MKKLALILSLASLPVFAGFKVTSIQQTENKLSVSFITEETFENICTLTLDEISISSPYAAFNTGILNEKIGIISATVSAHPETRCFRAGGVHSGKLVLDKGKELPRLQKGKTYQLKINGDHVRDIAIE